jgi:hypothetical protein
MPPYTTANVDITHSSLPDVAAMQIVTTNANCTHPSLPPFQSTTTDPSPLSIDNAEVVVLGIDSPLAEAATPAVDAAVNSTRAAGKNDTEVSNLIAFFNPLSKKPRCNTLRDSFNITPNASGGITIACKTCLNFGVSNCFTLLLERLIYSLTIVLSPSIFRPGSGGPSIQLLHEDTPCNVQEWQLKCVLALQNSQAGRLNKEMSLLTPPTDSTLGGESLLSIHKSAISEDSGTYPKKMKQTSLLCTTNNGMLTTMPLAEMERVYKK